MDVDAPQDEELLKIFAAHRELPETDFDAQRFLDFLTNPEETARGTGRWNIRFVAFIKDVQMHFGVCFSQADLDRNFSLSDFRNRIAHLQSHPRGSMQSLQNQRRHSDITFLIVGNLILLGIAYFTWSWLIARYLLIAAVVIFNGGFFIFQRKQRAYLDMLEKRIATRGS